MADYLSYFTLAVHLKEGEFSISRPDVHSCLTPGKYREIAGDFLITRQCYRDEDWSFLLQPKQRDFILFKSTEVPNFAEEKTTEESILLWIIMPQHCPPQFTCTFCY